MTSRKRTGLIRFVSMLLVCLLIAPAPVFATTTEIAQLYASAYLTSYNTYICPMGGGDLQIWFTVVGDTDMDYIGTMSIRLYESTNQSSWKLVKTFSTKTTVPCLLKTIISIHPMYLMMEQRGNTIKRTFAFTQAVGIAVTRGTCGLR